MVVLAAGVELAGVLLFIFRASNSGLEAAGAVLTLLPGLGSRLMTGIAALEAVGRGAARRLFRVVVVVEEVVLGADVVDKAGWVEVEAEGETDFSGSGAKAGKKKKKTIGKVFFKNKGSPTVQQYIPAAATHQVSPGPSGSC